MAAPTPASIPVSGNMGLVMAAVVAANTAKQNNLVDIIQLRKVSFYATAITNFSIFPTFDRFFSQLIQSYTYGVFAVFIAYRARK
jgi:hypothetical protein